jgi:hypothetical protein
MTRSCMNAVVNAWRFSENRFWNVCQFTIQILELFSRKFEAVRSQIKAFVDSFPIYLTRSSWMNSLEDDLLLKPQNQESSEELPHNLIMLTSPQIASIISKIFSKTIQLGNVWDYTFHRMSYSLPSPMRTFTRLHPHPTPFHPSTSFVPFINSISRTIKYPLVTWERL